MVGVEGNGADLDALSGNIFLFELSGNVPLDKGGFADTTVSDQDNLELSYYFRSLHLIIVTSIS